MWKCARCGATHPGQCSCAGSGTGQAPAAESTRAVMPPPTEDDFKWNTLNVYWDAQDYEEHSISRILSTFSALPSFIRRCFAAEQRVAALEAGPMLLNTARERIAELEAERDAALKRVTELEAHTLDCCGHRFGPEGP